MKTEYQYLTFELMPEQSSKTSAWFCKNKRSGTVLAHVKFHPPWRQYCFFPVIQAVYNKGCLSDISDFLNQLQEERK